jgi:hypothetical protein
MHVVGPRRLPDPFYYLRNFQAMLQTLLRRDADLLEAEETRFIADFANLPSPASALLVRMIMRKGCVFRASRLAYCEIPDLAAAVRPLLQLRWVDDQPKLPLDEMFRLFKKSEIAQLLALPEAALARPKAELLEGLREAYPEPLSPPLDVLSDMVYRLEIDALCERLKLMFFGNFRQEWSEFVLADLGIFRYETVALHAQCRPFRNRAHVAAFLRLYRCRGMLHEGRDLNVIEQELPPPIEDCDWLEARREKLRYQLARQRERAGEFDKALSLYSSCAYPEAQPRAERLLARAAGTVRRRPRPAHPAPIINLVIAEPAAGRAVELRALEALAEQGGSVHYVENALINSLFGLLCWPAIFAPIPGAFFHSFHHGPADLSCAGFFARRRAEFEQCFAELHAGTYLDTILDRFREKQGIISPFVAWGLLDESLLRVALACFPASHLRAWFEWILRDVRANRSGFPDLVQFWLDAATYRLIEVKGPGDRLQDNQRRCLDYCLTQHMPVAVCHVRWADSVSAALPAA